MKKVVILGCLGNDDKEKNLFRLHYRDNLFVSVHVCV